MAQVPDTTNDAKAIGLYGPWINKYRAEQRAAISSIPAVSVGRLITRLRTLLAEDRQLFVFGNGGSGANASHFANDLGKSASDALGKRFRVLCLNDNVSWMTALANDSAFEEVFRGQLMNFGNPGDMAVALSVSGSSPNVVRAMGWATEHGLFTAALVGGKRGRLADICDEVIAIDSTQYGPVEDAHMTICHMLCYGFIENPGWEKA